MAPKTLKSIFKVISDITDMLAVVSKYSYFVNVWNAKNLTLSLYLTALCQYQYCVI